MNLLKDLIDVLHENNFKATAQRIEILKFLTQKRIHPTAEEVYQKVRKKFPTISPATIYKTMQVLKDSGKIQELAFYDSKTRFDTNMQPHINLICLKCGKITDLADPKINEFTQQISNKTNFKRESQRIDFYGICKDCQE